MRGRARGRAGVNRSRGALAGQVAGGAARTQAKSQTTARGRVRGGGGIASRGSATPKTSRPSKAPEPVKIVQVKPPPLEASVPVPVAAI